MFESLFNPIYTDTFGFDTYLFCTLTSLLLGALIALVHSKTARSTPDFLLTLVLMPLVIQTILMLVNGNLGAGVAIAGAFGLIRFRSIQCKTNELLTLFIDMTIGVATSIGYLGLAAFFVIIVCVLMLTVCSLKSSLFNTVHKELRITIPESLNYENVFDDIFARYTSSCELTSVKTTNMGSLYRCTYDIVMSESAGSQEFINELRVRNGNLEIAIGPLPEYTQV